MNERVTVTSPVINKVQPLLRIGETNSSQYMRIDNGKPGSLQTAKEMARLVRVDTVRDEGLEQFAVKLITSKGLDSHSGPEAVIRRIFQYVQSIPYVHDPAGAFDSISTARQVLAKGYGDCDDLSVLLATLLALVGYRPRFVLARYKPTTKGFDHIYVDVVIQRAGDKKPIRVALDPSSRRHGMGWESPRALEQVTYPIFEGRASYTGLAGATSTAIATGAAIGANFIPLVGPFVSTAIGPVMSLFDRTQQRSEEAARDEMKNQLLAGMREIERLVNTCEKTPAWGRAQAEQFKQQFYADCDKFTKRSVAQSCRNFETEDIPGGAQQGAIATHIARISNAGAGCNGVASAGSNAAVGGAMMSDSSALLPLALAAGAALYFFTR